MKLKSKINTLAVAAGLGLMALSTPATAGADDNTLNIALGLENYNMDSYFTTHRIGIIMTRHIWDSLLYRDPVDFSYKPALATSFEWIDDTTIEFKLREGVTFHNGEPFDADDVVYTFNFISNPDNEILNQRNVQWIAGAEKVDQWTVRVLLKAPFPPAIDFIAGPLPIYPNEYYAKVGPEGMNLNPVGTGPYRVVSVEQGQKVVMEANENYWAGSPKGQPSIKTLVWRTIPDANTQIAELMSGGVDWMWKADPDQAQMLSAVPDIQVVGGETMRIGFLQFDAAGVSGDTPITNLLVRRAISHAISRQDIVKNLLPEGSQVVNPACYPTQVGCTTDVPTYDYNIDKAKQLMTEAGYPDGFDLELFYYRDTNLAEVMANDLGKIGINVTLNLQKPGVLRDMSIAGKTALIFWTWGSYSVNDASGSTGVYFGNGIERDLARDQQVNDWLEIGNTTIDLATREDAYKKALTRISDQAYWLSLWSYSYNYAFAKSLNFTPAADEIPRFFTASWK
ncbi:ABC transporter substrate-binding protein [Profundibacter amoris]|uniref:ABC transporter substrate-binding protein n=1 Tax=Profundibacter amoris TaxID=2171755 RepID=A0A347UFT5_9RHOB|nr:ABC transporter substrate-binding protein [Profundibacter amoris]AXX97713.1 ABC transporter substrate-binding protein [Profundibacter amoris]